MPRKRYTPEDIIQHLRTVELETGKGLAVLDACRKLGITEHTSYRWKKEFCFRRVLTAVCLLLVIALPIRSNAQAVPLPSFNVDKTQISVSGLSGGGFMAVQFDVAYSSLLNGAGIIAGGPYYCAQGDLETATTVCSCTGLFPAFCSLVSGGTHVPALIKITDQNAQDGVVDDTNHLTNQKIFLFSGKLDSKVPQPVMNDLQTYYRHYVGNANIFYEKNLRAEHAMPTDSFGNPCKTSQHPYINRCRYDAAGETLKWIYGSNLKSKSTGALSGSFIQFDQSEFITDPTFHGMDDSGWLFVPASCQQGELCKLHVVFHGCKQAQSYVPIDIPFGPIAGAYGTTFVKKTGYNEWADLNNIIVLYPQAATSAGNPNACWDWWGYDDPNYAKKTGRQMAAVKAMIDRISGVSH